MTETYDKTTQYQTEVVSSAAFDGKNAKLGTDYTGYSASSTATVGSVPNAMYMGESAQQVTYHKYRSSYYYQQTRDRWWKKYLTLTALLVVVSILVAWARGAFTADSVKFLVVALCDAFFVPGIIATAYGILRVVQRGGLLDFILLCIIKLIQLFKEDGVDRKYRNFYNYRKSLREKKRNFWYIVIVGAAFVAISGVLLGIYLSM